MSADRPVKPPRPPEGLAGAGQALWKALVADYGFTPPELALLAAAARQADDVAALEAVIAEDGMVVAGSSGQPRLNAAVAEVRQGRLALGKLLGLLALPAEDEKPRTASQERGRKAALARWDQPGQRTRQREAS